MIGPKKPSRSASAQTFHRFGKTTYGSNGTTYQQYCNTICDNRGNSYQQHGNTTYGPSGSTDQTFGNQTYINTPGGRTKTCSTYATTRDCD